MIFMALSNIFMALSNISMVLSTSRSERIHVSPKMWLHSQPVEIAVEDNVLNMTSLAGFPPPCLVREEGFLSR